jgi:hypothetical protein
MSSGESKMANCICEDEDGSRFPTIATAAAIYRNNPERVIEE